MQTISKFEFKLKSNFQIISFPLSLSHHAGRPPPPPPPPVHLSPRPIRVGPTAQSPLLLSLSATQQSGTAQLASRPSQSNRASRSSSPSLSRAHYCVDLTSPVSRHCFSSPRLLSLPFDISFYVSLSPMRRRNTRVPVDAVLEPCVHCSARLPCHARWC